MMRLRDPSSMAPAERLAEVAFHLAAGYRRLVLSRRNHLDLSARAEAPVPESEAGLAERR